MAAALVSWKKARRVAAKAMAEDCMLIIGLGRWRRSLMLGGFDFKW